MHMGIHRAARAAGLACAWIFFGTAALAADADWKPLFNGKNLNGWSTHYASKTPADAPAPSTIFKVEEGAIHVYPTQPAGSEQPNAYLETDADYKDYVLSLEYRWGEKKFAPRLNLVRDAGLLYHVHRTRPADWPASAEAQIQEGDVGDSWAVSARLSSFVDPKTGRYTLPENGGVPVTVGNDGKFERTRHNRVNEYPGWNTLEVIVRGDRATHVVNGVTNMRVYDIRGWDAATNSWVKVDHGKIVLQAESAEIFYRNIRIRPLTKADDMPPEPKVTEVWFPVPAKVTPGAALGAPPSDAIILFDGKNIDAWKSATAEGPARWKVVNGEMVVAPGHRRHPDAREIRRRAVARGVVRAATAARQGQPGPRQQRRVPAGCLRGAGTRHLREQDLREWPGGEYLQAISAAGERRHGRRQLAGVRHRVHRAALRRRRIIELAGARDRFPQRRAGAEQRDAQGRHDLHRRTEIPAAW